ncbi:MAG: putative protease [Parcubacteria group bacterium GW2011_GWF2_38_76]|nr:MAG: putative protease [Parcubacteria group bacterium GW2011_GWF2_38_76]HBM46111.1 hypothetical protein [Patescibacteria group bacterium]
MKNFLTKITLRKIFHFSAVIFFGLFILLLTSVITEEVLSPNCNVAKIPVRGEIVGYKSGGSEDWTDEAVAGDIYNLIERADNDSEIEAIIVEINSRGGSGVSGQELANALKRASKPTVALIKEEAASAAYYLATGADKIFVSEFSSIGSIAVTQSFSDDVEKSKKEGYNYNQLQTGKYKDMFSGDRPLTYEERQMILKELESVHDVLIKEIAVNRGLEVSEVAKIADGSDINTKKALELGLIDAFGDLYEVKQYLAQTLGLSVADINVCDDAY